MSKEGKILEGPDEIIDRQKEYFQELLKIKTAKSDEEKNIEQSITEVFDSMLKMEVGLPPIYTMKSEVEESIKELKKMC